MKGDNEVIKGLNEVLTGQLTAINQYFLHSRMLSDWGYEKLAGKVYKESIHQMKAAKDITDRILLLEGLPNYQKLLKLDIGENAMETLSNDKGFCETSCETLRRVTQLCLDKKDHVSREMMEDFLEKEESHLDWLEIQMKASAEVGKENYLAEKL